MIGHLEQQRERFTVECPELPAGQVHRVGLNRHMGYRLPKVVLGELTELPVGSLHLKVRHIHDQQPCLRCPGTGTARQTIHDRLPARSMPSHRMKCPRLRVARGRRPPGRFEQDIDLLRVHDVLDVEFLRTPATTKEGQQFRHVHHVINNPGVRHMSRPSSNYIASQSIPLAGPVAAAPPRIHHRSVPRKSAMPSRRAGPNTRRLRSGAIGDGERVDGLVGIEAARVGHHPYRSPADEPIL
jgi:hypothetical protein